MVVWFMRFFSKSPGNQMIEYALPLALLVTAGLVILLTTDMPIAIGNFFAKSNNGAAGGGGIQIASLGSPVGAGGVNNPGAPPACISTDSCTSNPDDGNEQEVSGNDGGEKPSDIEDVIKMIPEDNYFSDWLEQLANVGWNIGDYSEDVIDIDPDNIDAIINLFRNINTKGDYFERLYENFAGLLEIDESFLDNLTNITDIETLQEMMDYDGGSDDPHGGLEYICRGECSQAQMIIFEDYLASLIYGGEDNPLAERFELITESIKYFQENEYTDDIAKLVENAAKNVMNQVNRYSVYQSSIIYYDGEPDKSGLDYYNEHPEEYIPYAVEITDLVTGETNLVTDPMTVKYYIAKYTAEANGEEFTGWDQMEDLDLQNLNIPSEGAVTDTYVATGSTAVINKSSDEICTASESCSTNNDNTTTVNNSTETENTNG